MKNATELTRAAIDGDVARFREEGYLVIPGLVSGEELDLLREETLTQIEAGPEREPAGHFKIGLAADGKEVFFRMEAVATKTLRNDSPWKVMAHPRILQTVEGILGRSYICWADALLFKAAEGGAGIPMHCAHSWDSAPHEENLVVDVYLDRATTQNGCLKVLPGSHRIPAEESKELLKLGYEVPGLVDIELEPGDVLFHSEWLIHGSLPTPPLGQPSRRILYYAFRTPSALLADVPPDLDRANLAACVKRLQMAQERRRAAPYGMSDPAPDVVPPGWEGDVAAVDPGAVMEVGAAY